jgi:hypothetical protein
MPVAAPLIVTAFIIGFFALALFVSAGGRGRDQVAYFVAFVAMIMLVSAIWIGTAAEGWFRWR